jgi:endoglucanase
VSKAGWHDAGDYGRYIVNSGITTGTLLWTWEMFGPRLKNVKLNIPESGNGTPDILNEIRWNLDWMLTMQDDDGGVFHKQTSERFCGFVMPEKDSFISYVIGTAREPFKNSCATADFAAVMAIAARAYKPFQPQVAGQALRAARNAWTWVEKNLNVLFNNPQGVATGAYGDRNCGDEILWAAAELYRTTGDEHYHNYFLAHYGEFRNSVRPTGPQSWPNVANLGLWTYVLGKGKDAAAAEAIRTDALAAADEILRRSATNGYRISMTARDYVWGSNGVAANYGVQLLVADAFQRNPRYVETAIENLHYLLGRNTFSTSWVTHVGENPFRHPHHRPSGADNNPEPWPGLLSGGPNRSGGQDPAMKKHMPAQYPPAKGFIDDQESYSSNENAINWNAPLVFLLAGALR